MARKPQATTITVAERALDSIGAWKEPSDDAFVRGHYQGPAGPWAIAAHVDDAGRVVFYSQCPFPVPEDRRAAVNEFVTRANFGIVIGDFEMDLDDGEVRYKTSIDFGEAPPSQDQADRALAWNVGTMARYLSGLAAVAAGADVIPALYEVESA